MDQDQSPDASALPAGQAADSAAPHLSLQCSEVRLILSARLDGEDEGPRGDLADAHLTSCPECAAWFAQATAMNRSLRVRPAPEAGRTGPNRYFAEEILAAADDDFAPVRARGVLIRVITRTVLIILALIHVAWAITLVSQLGAQPVAGEFEPAYYRLVVDAATWRFAAAAGLCFAAWRPRSALTLVVMVGAAGAFHFGFIARDVVMGLATGEQLASVLLALVSMISLVAAFLSNQPSYSYLSWWRAAAARPIS